MTHFLIFKKFPVIPPVCILPKFFKNFYLKTNCFDDGNGFRQLSESLKWVGALYEFLKKLLFISLIRIFS